MASSPDIAGSGTLLGSLQRGTDRYVDLSDIVGGALVATAVSLILVTFGSALGLSFSAIEPGEGLSLRWVAIGGGLWVIWTAVTSSAAGGYFAGRMRKPVGDADADEVETRDGAHGVGVWALATLLTVVVAASGFGGTVKVLGATFGGAAGRIASVIEQDSDYRAGIALRGDRLSSKEARSEVAGVLRRSLSDGAVTEADRSYLARILATETGLAPSQARVRIDQVIADAERARDQAMKAAEQARVFALIGAFVIAASLLVSGAAAYFAAVLGGKHRNENIGFARFGSVQRKRAIR